VIFRREPQCSAGSLESTIITEKGRQSPNIETGPMFVHDSHVSITARRLYPGLPSFWVQKSANCPNRTPSRNL
jgi:hypothetical protein